MTMQIAVVGYGVVGKAMKQLFPDAVIYDVLPGVASSCQAVNACDIAFVCVPTPQSPDGSCDISAVEDVVSWVQCPLIVIRSTIPPGTCKTLSARYGKRIVFQPEYLGETVAHPFADMRGREFVVLGGEGDDTAQVADAYCRVHHSSLRFYFTDSTTAELAKYMENCFFATKVIFCHEFYQLAQALGVDYHQLREAWLADTRVSRDHTFVYPDQPGFSGKCLPKDLSAVIKAGEQAGYDPQLLRAVKQVNAHIRRGCQEQSAAKPHVEARKEAVPELARRVG